MGLNVSAAAFVLAMGRIFQNREYYHFLYNYIDDIAIASRTFSEHLSHLETVFKTVRVNNMRLNPTKTSIGFHEMEFLGFTVSDKGISISPRKMEAIKRIAVPSNKKSLQKLIGLAQYFRRYIPSFSSKIANMRQLLKKDQKFIWTENCQQELDHLKRLLLEAPILQPIANDRPIFLYIDASTTGVGGVVLQYGDDDRSPHVCGYISFATTDTQRRWNPYQLEFLALGLCLRQYETVFLHSNLTVFTDNATVAAIQNYRPLNNRERRLIAYISQFPMTLRYLPGRKNTIADCLSRIGEDLKKEDLVKMLPPEKLYDEEFILSLNEKENKPWTVYSLHDVPTDLKDVNPLRRSSRIAER